MARKNSRAHNIFIDNKRIGGNKFNTSEPIKENYDLPNGIKLHDEIEFISPKDIVPHSENEELFKADKETLERWDIFKKDIKDNGIHDAIIVRLSDKVILTGHRRYKAAIELDLEFMPVRYLLGHISESDSIKFMLRDNALRRQFSPKTLLEIYRKIWNNFDKLILIENRGGDFRGNQHKKVGKTESSVLPENDKLTAKKIAQETGQKTNTVEKQLYKIRKKLKDEKKEKILPIIKLNKINKFNAKTTRNFIKKAFDGFETKPEFIRQLKKITKDLENV